MIIKYLADVHLPSKRANSVNIMKMCEGFANAGVDCELIVPSFTGTEDLEGIYRYYKIETKFPIRFIRVPRLQGIWLFCFALFVAIRFRSCERGVLFFGRSLLATAAVSILQKNVSLDFHGRMWANSFFNRHLIKRICNSRRPNLFSFNSEQLKQAFCIDFPHVFASKIKLVYAPNGASIPLEYTAFKDFIEHGRIKIGYVGAFLPGRGLGLIIELAKQLPEHTFHLAGGTREELSIVASGASIPSNLHCYGHVPFESTFAFRDKCDILLAPYQQDTAVPSGEITVDYMSPIKIFEYMSNGKAIVCSDLPACRVVLDDTNCLFVAPSDVSAWKNAIERFENLQLRERMGLNARKKLLNSFTWAKRAKTIIDNLK